MSLSDRRRCPRFPFHSRGRLLLIDRELDGSLIDISLSGALFAIDLPGDLPSGVACRLAIHHHHQSPARCFCGIAVYRAGPLVGIEFRDIDGDAEEELRLMIEMNLASPQLLDRDLPALLR